MFILCILRPLWISKISDQPTDETEVHMEDETTQMSFQDSSSPLAHPTSPVTQSKQHVHIIGKLEF